VSARAADAGAINVGDIDHGGASPMAVDNNLRAGRGKALGDRTAKAFYPRQWQWPPRRRGENGRR